MPTLELPSVKREHYGWFYVQVNLIYCSNCYSKLLTALVVVEPLLALKWVSHSLTASCMVSFILSCKFQKDINIKSHTFNVTVLCFDKLTLAP